LQVIYKTSIKADSKKEQFINYIVISYCPVGSAFYVFGPKTRAFARAHTQTDIPSLLQCIALGRQ